MEFTGILHSMLRFLYKSIIETIIHGNSNSAPISHQESPLKFVYIECFDLDTYKIRNSLINQINILYLTNFSCALVPEGSLTLAEVCYIVSCTLSKSVIHIFLQGVLSLNS